MIRMRCTVQIVVRRARTVKVIAEASLNHGEVPNTTGHVALQVELPNMLKLQGFVSPMKLWSALVQFIPLCLTSDG